MLMETYSPFSVFPFCKITNYLMNLHLIRMLFNNNYRSDCLCSNPMLPAVSISNCNKGSRSFGTRLSNTASLSVFFNTPTSRHGDSPNISMISFPSMTGCNNRPHRVSSSRRRHRPHHSTDAARHCPSPLHLQWQ